MNRIFSILIASLFLFPRPSLADDKKLSAILDAYARFQYKVNDFPFHTEIRIAGSMGTVGLSGASTHSFSMDAKPRRAIDRKLDSSTMTVTTISSGLIGLPDLVKRNEGLDVRDKIDFSDLATALGKKEQPLFLDRLISGWSLSQLLKSALSVDEVREAERLLELPWPHQPKETREISISAEMVNYYLIAKELNPALGKEVKGLIEEHRQLQITTPSPGQTEAILGRIGQTIQEGWDRRRMRERAGQSPGHE